MMGYTGSPTLRPLLLVCSNWVAIKFRMTKHSRGSCDEDEDFDIDDAEYGDIGADNSMAVGAGGGPTKRGSRGAAQEAPMGMALSMEGVATSCSWTTSS